MPSNVVPEKTSIDSVQSESIPGFLCTVTAAPVFGQVSKSYLEFPIPISFLLHMHTPMCVHMKGQNSDMGAQNLGMEYFLTVQRCVAFLYFVKHLFNYEKTCCTYLTM